MIKFSNWLVENTSLTKNVVRDVNSRSNRVRKLIGDIDHEDLAELLTKLESNDVFQSLSRTVKSQLRRALKLYCEFRRNNSNG
jgi:site-specific recombinase XerC